MVGLRKSLFVRYFTLCASITLSSIALLEILLATLSANYFSQESLSSIEIRAQQMSEFVAENYEGNDRQYIDAESISRSFEIMSSVSQADILLTDTSGTVVYAIAFPESDDDSASLQPQEIEELTGAAVDSDIQDKVMTDGLYRKLGRFGTLYEKRVFAVGVPVQSGDTVIGAVYVITPTTEFGQYMQALFRLFLLGAVLAVLICSWILYYSTEAMVRPLHAMAKAANDFANGDFSVRVPEEGDEEVMQLACAFNKMAESLAMQELSGRTFVANVSHELKTPMTTIGGFIDGILDGTIPQEKSHYYLRIVSQEVKRLSRMVVSMLNISRIEAGEMKINPKQTDINELVCRTVIGFEQKIDEKKLEIEGLDVENMYVDADPDLVSQIVYNLIENAVKFTPEGGTISVFYKVKGGMLETTIRNTGEGISREEMAKLFDRFYKSDRSRSMDKTGVGLGLHIVRSLVRLHGGEVNVRSTQGEYTEFSFTLPLFIQKNIPVLFRKPKKAPLTVVNEPQNEPQEGDAHEQPTEPADR